MKGCYGYGELPALREKRGATTLALPFTDTVTLYENPAYLPVVRRLYVRHWWRDDDEWQGLPPFHGASVHRPDRQVFSLRQSSGLDFHAGGVLVGWEMVCQCGAKNMAISTTHGFTFKECSNLSQKTKMTMAVSIMNNMLFVSVALLLAGCSQTTTPDAEPIKTTAYYAANPEIAKAVAKKCAAMEKNELSLITPSKRKAWDETNVGINCANAQLAYGNIILIENQRKYLKSDSKYGNPSASASK